MDGRDLRLRSLKSNTIWAMLAGGAAAVLFRYLQDLLRRFQRQEAESLWRRHVDLSVVQADNVAACKGDMQIMRVM